MSFEEVNSMDDINPEGSERKSTTGTVHQGSAHVEITASASGHAIILTNLHNNLLDCARRLLKTGEFAASLVSSVTACEVLTENTLSVAAGKRQIDDIVGVVLVELFQSHNLSNQRLLRLYEALTGDLIAREDFWGCYQATVKLRHAAVHKGVAISKDQALQAIRTAERFVAHLEQCRARVAQ
jgi:hypothetical protein